MSGMEITKWIQFLRDAIRLSSGWRIPLFALASAIAAVSLFWPHLGGPAVYPEFVVGPHSWGADNKERDIQAFRLLMVLAPVMYIILAMLFAGLRRRDLSSAVVNRWLDYLLLLIAPWLGLMLFGAEVWMPQAWLLGLLVALACSFLIGAAVRNIPAPVLTRWIHAFIFIFIASFFTGIALALSASQCWPAFVLSNRLLLYILSFGPLLAAMAVCGIALIFPTNLERRDTWIRWLMVPVQVGVPLLVVSVLPPPLRQGDVWVGQPASGMLTGLCVAFVAFAWLNLWRRTRTAERDAAGKWSARISVWCLSGIAILFVVRRPMSAILWSDDFHMGEALLPWHQLMSFGAVPYVDFIPFHGAMHLLHAWVGECFYGGGIAGHFYASNLTYASAAVICFWSVSRIADIRLALFCAVFFIPISFYNGRILFLAPLILLLAVPRLVHGPAWWLPLWALLGVFSLFYNAVSGFAFVVATAPFAVVQIATLWRSSRRDAGLLVVAGAMVALGVFVIPIARDILLGYLQFMLDNRLAYAVSRGIAWTAGWSQVAVDGGPLSHRVWYEAFRFAWVPVCLFAAYLWMATLLGKSPRDRVNTYLFPSVTLVLLALSMYTIRRIDAGGMSRPGAVSYMAVALLLPVCVYRFRPAMISTALIPLALWLGAFGALYGFGDRLHLQGLFWRTQRVADVPSEMVYHTSNSADLKGLAHVAIDRERYELFLRFAKALDEVAPDRSSTYYDLTNRMLLYVLTDRRVPARYAAEASAVNSRHQRLVVEALVSDPPPVIFAAPIQVVDQRSNLRSYHLYRHAVLNYRPVVMDGFVFLVNEKSPVYPHEQLLNERVELLADIFSYYNLSHIPGSWGASWESLQHVARPVVHLEPGAWTEVDERHIMDIDLGDLALSGREADLLVLRFEGQGTWLPDSVNLSWRTQEGVSWSRQVSAQMRGGVMVIPLGAFPEWLLMGDLQMIRLESLTPVVLRSAGLWQRSDWR